MLSLEQQIITELCFNNGQQAHQQENYPVAEHYYKRIIQLDPDNEQVNYTLIYPLALQRKYAEAIEQCTKSMQSEKYRDDAHYSRGLIRLNIGDYIEGFKDFEIRLKQRPIAAIHEKLAVRPYWNGEECKTLYIFGEQGFGDILMFSRYLPLIKTKFKVEKIYFEVPQSCNELFKYTFRNDPEIEVISVRSTYELLGTDEHFLSSDYYIQQLSLARIFETSFDTVPSIHIEVEPKYIEKFKHLSEKPTVAICCGGRPINGDPAVAEWNNRRNVDENIVTKLLKEHGYDVISLEQEKNSDLKSWSDTAGTVANCKFVISIDSGPIHLVGALSKPTILLNHYMSCWRWTMNEDKTPWYDCIKIIRQKRDRDWSTVYEELKEELKNYV